MAARPNAVNSDDLSGATLEMVREMVRRAEAKLSSLESRRTEIRRRIQALHHLSRTVAASTVGPWVEDHVSAADQPLTEQALARSEKQNSIDNPRANAPHERESSALRRACRIALMESEEAECCTQIVQRIKRRDSVSLKNSNSAREVTAELNRMVADCEASTFGVGDSQRWQLNRTKNRYQASFDGQN